VRRSRQGRNRRRWPAWIADLERQDHPGGEGKIALMTAPSWPDGVSLTEE
jgi:hypothetical protein